MLRRFLSVSLVSLLFSGLAATLAAPIAPAAAADAKALAPAQIKGVAVYVPFNVNIKVDGKLSDWAGVPSQMVDYGSSVSPDPANDGSFTFQVAADQANFYINMVAVDKTIVAGTHGDAFWNEDSMEFYFNTSGDLNANSYGLKEWQINVNAADIGNKDPNKLTLTGVNSDRIHVKGFVFKTVSPAGWGFEAAVPMSDLGITPTAGLNIGFNAQLNGATTKDRDVQLVWSKADTSNMSYQTPSVFGTAIFVKAGQTAAPTPNRVMPTPTPVVTPPPVKQVVSVNQVGYYSSDLKIASYASDATSPLTWKLLDATGQEVSSGQTTVFGADASSGDNVHLIDFSSYTKAGIGYVLSVGNISSDPFAISTGVYTGLAKDALAYYYRDRSGIAITAQYAGAEWARDAGHLSDNHVTCYKGTDSTGKVWPGCDYYLDVSGGWYDAGDYGKYVVNGGIAVWTLMDEYERNPKSFGDGTLNIPENANGVPDILDEARWELKFMLGMQVPAGQTLAGMVHHKMHDGTWSNVPSMPATLATNRYLFPPSTAATLNLAAVGAQCARIWKTIDPAFSAQCLAASETAWTAAQANPAMYAVAFPNVGGGEYSDTSVTDEFYWAASELYVTTGKDTYQTFLLASPDWAKGEVPDWGNTATLGTTTLALVSNQLPADKVSACRKAIRDAADTRLRFIAQQGYRMPLVSFAWGSNSEVLNSAMIMGLAYQFTGERKYLDGVVQSMDYILGRNAMNKSYVTGYGTDPVAHPHHRFWANQPTLNYPAPPPGVLSGGPNGSPSDPAADAAGLAIKPDEKSYLDDIGSFSTNEVAINWNAPLAWVSAFVDKEQAPVAAQVTAHVDEGAPAWLLAVVPAILIVIVGAGLWFRRKSRRLGVRK